jgi:hypothetical protein
MRLPIPGGPPDLCGLHRHGLHVFGRCGTSVCDVGYRREPEAAEPQHHGSRSHEKPSREQRRVATSPYVCPVSQGDTPRRDIIRLMLRGSAREAYPCGEARRKTAMSRLAQCERAGRCILPSGNGTGRVTPRQPSCQHRRGASEPLGRQMPTPEGLALRVQPRGLWGRRQSLRFQHG